MPRGREILQIVPRAPGSHEGVGDYAQLLAAGLERKLGCLTTFVAAQPAEGPNILAPLADISDEEWRRHSALAVVLHYVSYGYQARGIPRFLPKKIARIRELCGGRLITIFHELFAAGSWRQSAFWLRPIQRHITRSIAQSSAVCMVSSSVLAEQLQELAPRIPVVVRPVVSTFGEPELTPEQLAQRDPQRWAICGGTELIRRSLRSFREAQPESEELFVLGGGDRADIRELLPKGARYFPGVEKSFASEILATCAFGWIDYFEHAHVPYAAVLKSTAFAAYCAHGVIPVFPANGSAIALAHDRLPGPFSLENLPTAEERPAIAQATYDWYGRNASSVRLAESIAQMLAPVASGFGK